MNKTVTLLPFQLIEYDDVLIMRRGSIQIFVQGENRLETVLLIVTETSGKSTNTDDILNMFSPIKREHVQVLLNELISQRLLVSPTDLSYNIDDETNEDVFYWEHNTSKKGIDGLLTEQHFWLIGNNALGHYIYNSLRETGINVKGIIDDKALYQATHSNSNYPIIKMAEWRQNQSTAKDVMIGCLPFGGQALLLEWNQWCIKNDILFLPVVIDAHKAQIGPLVIPYQGPCLLCLRQRQNAHLKDSKLLRHHEKTADIGQEIAGVHPVHLRIAAEMVSLEIIKFNARISTRLSNSLLSMNYDTMESNYNPVLKTPRCQVCSRMNRTSEMSLKKMQSKKL